MAKPITLPTWNTDGSNRTTPSSGQQVTGWTLGQTPPSSWWNWLAYHTYEWCKWVNDNALSAADIAAAAWEWTEYHIFRRPVSIYGYGPVAALLVIPDGANPAISTTGSISGGTVAASSTISTSANITAGTSISAGGNIVATGYVSGTGITSMSGESTLGHSSTGADHPTLTLSNSGGSGSYALRITAGHTQVDTLTATSVAATRGVFVGSAVTAPVCLSSPVAALPTNPVTGDVVIRFDAGVTYLYHCDAAPGSWSRIALTRMY